MLSHAVALTLPNPLPVSLPAESDTYRDSSDRVTTATYVEVAAPGAGYRLQITEATVNNKDWNQLLAQLVEDPAGAATDLGYGTWGFDRGGGISVKPEGLLLNENKAAGWVTTGSSVLFSTSIAYKVIPV